MRFKESKAYYDGGSMRYKGEIAYTVGGGTTTSTSGDANTKLTKPNVR